MNYPVIPLAQQIIQLCQQKGIANVVISPGSRNAPLTIGFAAHPEIQTYSIVDERCAAFFALGMAQQIQQPVAVVCTSGSAMLNYYPAIAEAFYSDIPLVIISADRPKHLIDVGDGQTIRQENIFDRHILYSANLEEGKDQFNTKEINQALNVALIDQGPVHINAPFSEPLYNTQSAFTTPVTLIEPRDVVEDTSDAVFNEFKEHWSQAKKKMVLIGVNTPNTVKQEYLDLLGNDPSVLVFTESTSNLHHQNFFPSIDKIIFTLSEEEFKALQPDVLLTLGGMVVSKKIKAYLRTYQPKAHFHVNPKKAFDTYFNLTKHYKVRANTFFKKYKEVIAAGEGNYRDHWLAVKGRRTLKHRSYLETTPFSDLKAFQHILPSVPEESVLHLSNSSTIRYVQLFNDKPSVDQYCNRGTSGIDGSTATAIGHAVQSSKQHILITGDLSFFYDSNALWNNYIPNNFRIIIINNGGGGIFRILPGNKNTDDFDTYFETKHQLSAKQLALMYGFDYIVVSEENTLIEQLSSFYSEGNQPKIIEVFTPRTLNDEILIGYFNNFND